MPALYTGLAIIAWMTFAALVAGAIIWTAFMLAFGIRGAFRKLRNQAGGDGSDGAGNNMHHDCGE